MLPLRRPSLLLLCASLSLACDNPSSSTPPKAQPTAGGSATGSNATSAIKTPKIYERVILSPVYEVKTIYKSMTGPQSSENIALDKASPLELLWIVGFEAVMVEPEGKQRISQEFMCHTNLDIDPTAYQKTFVGKKRISGRLFTLSQGQHRIDLPKGMGIPILSDELMSLNTQVLNLNMKDGAADVRHRVVMRYVRDKDLTSPYKALYSAGAYGLKLLEGPDGHYGLASGSDSAAPAPSAAPAAAPSATASQSTDPHAGHDTSEHGPGCLPGQNAGTNEFDDNAGRTFTGHWVVKPGREENHTQVGDIMDLPFDTTLHYVAVHLHPFAESLELIDRTTGKSIYKAFTKQADKGVGLAHVDHYSSEAGIPLYRDHDYEIVSIYNNTSGRDQDSMAVMNLYMHDAEFRKPDLKALAQQRLDEAKKAAAAGAGSAATEAPPTPKTQARPSM